MVEPIRPVPGSSTWVKLTPGCVIVRERGTTRRVRLEDVVDLKVRPKRGPRTSDPIREGRLVLVTKDLERVVLPVRDERLYWGLKALLAARDGETDRLVRYLTELLRIAGRPPLAERRGGRVLLRWPWLELELPVERAETVYRRLLSEWRELLESDEYDHDLSREGRPRWVALSVPLAPAVMLVGVHRKLVAQASSVLVMGAKVAVKGLGRVLGPGIYPALRDVGIGLVPALPWLALFACLYWLLARRVLSTVDDELLRFVLTQRLAGMGAATGLWCLLAPFAARTYALPVAVIAAWVSVIPAVRTASACLKDPERFAIALMEVGTCARLAFAAGACAALAAAVVEGPLAGGVAELISAVAYAHVVSSRVEAASGLARRVWIPGGQRAGGTA
ncbi:MAG: hypothetical protein ACXQTC_03415 [Methanopyraceae archaeon]